MAALMRSNLWRAEAPNNIKQDRNPALSSERKTLQTFLGAQS